MAFERDAAETPASCYIYGRSYEGKKGKKRRQEGESKKDICCKRTDTCLTSDAGSSQLLAKF